MAELELDAAMRAHVAGVLLSCSQDSARRERALATAKRVLRAAMVTQPDDAQALDDACVLLIAQVRVFDHLALLAGAEPGARPRVRRRRG